MPRIDGRRITKRDRNWLTHFARGYRERPPGMGPQGVSNFVSRNWIIRLERDEPFGPELYRLTPEGLKAHQELGAR